MNKKEQLLQEVKLRRIIRKAISLKKNKQQLEEKKLRKIIRKLVLLQEGDVDSDTKPAPYSSTPVNALADAFNQILPILKAGLRKLAQPEERISYSNFEGLDGQQSGMVGEGDINEQEEDKLTINIDDENRVMPSDGKEDERFKEPEKDPEKEIETDFESFKMAGENPTGARVAFETINDSNIVQVLSDKRRVLYKPEYKEEFKQYALYNVDLWLLTYEKELADSLGQEPAFTETVMEKPTGAEVAGTASEFESVAASPEEEAGVPDLGDFEDNFEGDLEEILMME